MSTKAELLLKQHEANVVKFLKDGNGHFVVFSDDTSFVKLIRNLVVKQLVLPEETISYVQLDKHLMDHIARYNRQKKNMVVFFERMIEHKEMSYYIQEIRKRFPEEKIIVLTNEVGPERLILLHELGADNFITKPLSINNLIEKVSYTIKPHGKMNQLMALGKKLVNDGKFEDAIRLAQQVLELKPKSAAAYILIGEAFEGMGRKEQAVTAYEHASDSAKVFLDPLKKLAELHKSEKNFEEALGYLERLDSLSPLNVNRKVEIGGIHLELGNEGTAEEYFDAAVVQAKKDAEVIVAHVMMKIAGEYIGRDPAKAEVYYRNALDMKGGNLSIEDVKTINLLAIALRKQGKWDEAIDEYNRALGVAVDDENLHYNIALAYAEGKDFTSSVQSLEKVRMINPGFHKQSPILSHNMGMIYYKAGNLESSRELLENALEMDPSMESPKKFLAAIDKKEGKA